MPGDPDVVVIGAGPNGLVAAGVLARAGLDVLVLEARADRPGGAVSSEAATLPGFSHDVGAAFFPFATRSPAFADLDLVGHGLRWRTCPVESSHPAPDGSHAAIVRDPERALRSFGSPEDGRAFADLVGFHASIEPALLAALLGPLPPIAAALRLGPALARIAAMFLHSGRGLSERLFRSEAARRVLPGLALHVDVGPDDRLGAGLGYMLGALAATGGFVVPEGGARAITDTLVRILVGHGGRVRLGSRVQHVLVDDGGARAVRLCDGTEIAARRAVLANVSAPGLFLDLVERQWIPARVVEFMERFPQGWGTFKLDWALSGPVPWTVPEACESAVVHAGDSLDDLARFTRQVRAGELPEHPYLVIGQQSLADPSRAPPGQHTLWAYSRVPSRAPGGWSAHRESFADRVEARIEALAPGFGARILARRAVTPDDLETMDENLRGGDIGGGSNAWHRQLIFRPLFPYFRYRTPVERLYLCSSYAHPGAGVHGMCGHNAAHAVLADLGGRPTSRP